MRYDLHRSYNGITRLFSRRVPHEGTVGHVQSFKSFHYTSEGGFVLDRVVSIQCAIEFVSNAQVKEVITAAFFYTSTTCNVFASHVECESLNDRVVRSVVDQFASVHQPKTELNRSILEPI